MLESFSKPMRSKSLGTGPTIDFIWFTFIRNRLEIAKLLLKKDGALIVAIDENEQCHLGVLLKDNF